MCRSIVRFFIAVFIILFGTLLAFLLNIRFRLLESNYYKSFLKDNGAYELVLKTGKSYIENSGGQEGTLLIQPIMDTIIDDIATPEFLQKVVDKNLDNLFAFLHGRRDRLYLYFPKDELLAKLDTKVIDSIENEITALIKSLPTCAPGQENQFEGMEIGATSRIQCLPEGFQAPTQDFSQILEDFQTYTGENPLEGVFEEGGLLPGFSEETDVVKLIQQGPKEPNAPDPEKALKDVQQGFNYFNIGLIVAGVLLFAFIIFYVLLGDKSKMLSSLGTIFILLGFPIIVMGAFLSFSGILSSFLFDQLISQKLPPEILEQFGFLPDLISKFLSGAFLPIFITGAILIFIGIVCVIVQRFLSKKEVDNVVDVKEQKNDIQKGDNKSKGT